jgi:hypothetical protein
MCSRFVVEESTDGSVAALIGDPCFTGAALDLCVTCVGKIFYVEWHGLAGGIGDEVGIHSGWVGEEDEMILCK